ncbi:unnamed protein product [Soboliphyme baturini]|uniref:TGF_BETA_2 domain-containing protein n=1 Tax=Soboliphyme baturini TaxID=241478 RepID=A0A183J8V5_9BILA|nr:unnamed protein product [Soboliphyme baturini]
MHHNAPYGLVIGSTPLPSMSKFFDAFLRVNITNAVKLLLSLHQWHVCFEVTIKSNCDFSSVSTEVVVDSLSLNSASFRTPLLVCYAQSLERYADHHNEYRRRRDLHVNEKEMFEYDRSGIGTCRLYEWYVDLNDIVPLEIIQPRGFYANYCAGFKRMGVKVLGRRISAQGLLKALCIHLQIMFQFVHFLDVLLRKLTSCVVSGLKY